MIIVLLFAFCDDYDDDGDDYDEDHDGSLCPGENRIPLQTNLRIISWSGL